MTLIRANKIYSSNALLNQNVIVSNGQKRGNFLQPINGQLAAGYQTAYKLDNNGKVWSWGSNYQYELGNGSGDSNASVSSPSLVLASNKFVQISAGQNNLLLLDYQGYAWATGAYGEGEFGNNNYTNGLSPIRAAMNRRYVGISSGYVNSLFLDSNGYAWTCGYNANGTLGTNDVISYSSPASVVGGKQFVQAVCSKWYSCYGIDRGGYAWSWGYNAYGELGNNSISNTSSPVSVVGGKKFFQISGGHDFVLALDQDGYCWSWGNNQYGQLGDNTLSSRSSPVSVVGGRKFIRIDAGNTHSLALDINGYCWSWGDNTGGKLGAALAAGNSMSSPVSVVGGLKLYGISAGYEHSLTVDSRGLVWSWGLNDAGQLGINTRVSKNSPVMVVRLFQ